MASTYGVATYGVGTYGSTAPLSSTVGVVPEHRVRLKFGATWVDVTADVFNDTPIQVTTGRSPESTSASTSTLRLALNNLSGNYTVKNPRGAYYGLLQRNTPIDFAVNTGAVRLFSPVSAGSFDDTHRATTPSNAALDIVGDLDLRVERSGRFDNGTVISRDNRYWLNVNGQGIPFLQWRQSNGTIRSAWCTEQVSTMSRLAIRATLDVDNGSGGCVVAFYTAPLLAGSYVQLGQPVTQAFTTDIGTDTTGATIGGGSDSYCYKGEIRNGIAGAVVANPNFTIQNEGTTSFTDGAGRVWTVNGRSSVTSWSTRFTGFIAEFDPSWDRSQQVVTQSISASGVLRRLNQSAALDQSPFYTAMVARNPTAYWPMEDLDGSSTFAAASPNTQPMVITGGVDLANDDTTFVAAKALSAWTAPAGTTGLVPAYVPSAAGVQIRCLFKATGSSGSFMIQVLTTGAHKFVFSYAPSTDMGRIDMINQSTGLTEASYVPAFNMAAVFNGAHGGRFSLELKQNGTGIDWNVVWLAPGSTGGFNFGVLTIPTATLGSVYAVQPFATDPNITAVVGHVTVENTISSIFDLAQVLNAYINEGAAARITRVCLAAGVDQEQIGVDAGSPMGPEPIATLPDKLQECVDADEGVLFEARAFAGLYYRERGDMYSLPPAYSVRYGSLNELTVPVEDDQLLRNDVTVTRPSGSSARAQRVDGPLQVSDPPVGVGRYSTSDTANLASDAVLQFHADWRVHLGTMDDPRFPVISLDVHSPYLSADLTSILDIQIGDRVDITSPPAWFPPYDARQQVFQVTESLTLEGYNISLAARPQRAQAVGFYDSYTVGRYDASAASLVAGVGATTTSFLVSGELWVTTASMPTAFPFNVQVGGEVMTVTAITSATLPQTFTVTRSVNGVVLAHDPSTPVSLAEPAYYGI